MQYHETKVDPYTTYNQEEEYESDLNLKDEVENEENRLEDDENQSEEIDHEKVEQLPLPTLSFAFDTEGQHEREERRSKRFSIAGQLSLEINGHVIFKKLALAEGKQSEAKRHEDFIESLLQKAAALGVELNLNSVTGRYRLTRPTKVARSLNDTVKQQLLGIFDHKISEKQFQIEDLGKISLSIRRTLADQTELSVAKMTEITTQLSDLAANQNELQTQVSLLKQLREEMTEIIIRF